MNKNNFICFLERKFSDNKNLIVKILCIEKWYNFVVSIELVIMFVKFFLLSTWSPVVFYKGFIANDILIIMLLINKI